MAELSTLTLNKIMKTKFSALILTSCLLAGSAWAVPFSLMPMGSTASAPVAPDQPGYEDATLDAITWTWRDQSFNEDAFLIYAGPVAEAPEAVTHRADANTQSWRHEGLSPNTLHTMRVSAENEHGESAKSAAVQAWTLAATPLAPLVADLGRDSLTLQIAGGDGNPSHTEYAVYLVEEEAWLQADGTRGISPLWRTTEAWATVTVSGLAGAQGYEFQVQARNGSGAETPNSPGTLVHTRVMLQYAAGAGGTLGGSSTQMIAYGGSGTEVTAIPDSGYQFTGWNDGITTAIRQDSGVEEDLSVEALFEASSYTITFASHGGITPDPATKVVTFDSAYGALAATERIGYAFAGWWTEEMGGQEVTAETVVSTADNHTLHARWTANTYLVSFDARGGSDPEPENIQVTFDGTYGELATTDRTGYTFAGWWTAIEGGSQVTDETLVSLAGDHTLYARWTAESYTVTFDARDGSDPEPTSTEVVFDSAYGELAITGRTGYTFAGWWTAEEEGMLINPDTVLAIAANHTLYAQWSVLYYTLSYSALNGGQIEGEVSQSVPHGSDGTAVVAVPDSGYRFAGWSDGVETATRMDQNVEGPIEAMAYFLRQFMLTYEAGEGGSLTGETSQVVDQGADGETVTAVADEGYRFAGWSDGETEASRRDLAVGEDIHATANFIQQFTVEYLAAEGGTVQGPNPQQVDLGGNGELVTAVPLAGYAFLSWSDGLLTASRAESEVGGDQTHTAHFRLAPPVVDFVGTPLSGDSPLEVEFTNLTTTGVNHFTWYFGDEDFSEPWRKASGLQSIEPIAGHAAISLSDGSVVMMGGRIGGESGILSSEVWRSTDQGMTWVQQTEEAPWGPREGHHAVRLPGDKILLIGGREPGNSTAELKDAWISEDRGVTWTRIVEQAPWPALIGGAVAATSDGVVYLITPPGEFGNEVWTSFDGSDWLSTGPADFSPRTDFAAVALYGGMLVVSGGVASEDGETLDDVWRSGSWGMFWMQDMDPAPFGARSGHRAVLIEEDHGYYSEHRILIVGGKNQHGQPVTDVWGMRDSDDTWARQSANAGWSGKTEFAAVALSDGSVLVIGGAPSSDEPLWISADFGETWEVVQGQSATGRAPWSARAHHASVLLADGSAVVAGGIGAGGHLGDVWSLDGPDGNWARQNADAPWTARQGAAFAVLFDGGLLLMGGESAAGPENDLWYSPDNGASWEEVLEQAPWAARSGHRVVTLQDGSLLLLGGVGASGPLADVWHSADLLQGKVWVPRAASADWGARSGHQVVAMRSGSLLLVGGETQHGYANDIWSSADQGASWNLVSTNAEFAARKDHSLVELPDGSLVLFGGMTQDGPVHDVWRSVDQGASWVQISDSAAWAPRGGQAALVMRDGRVLLMGGSDAEGAKQDVWLWSTASSLEEHPVHTYRSTGAHTVTLMAYSDVAAGVERKQNYVAVGVSFVLVEVGVEPAEAGHVTGSGQYVEGEFVLLTAHANTGYRFSHWSENGELLSGETTLQFTAGHDRQIFAHFELPRISVRYHAGAGGHIDGDPEQHVLPGETTRSVEAIPDDGAEFAGWSDGITANPRVDEDVHSEIEVFAHFRSTGGVEIDWYADHGIELESGQTWADIDNIDRFRKGMTLREEFIAGTDPNDPRSRFATESPVLDSSGFITLRWQSAPGRIYDIEWSHDLRSWHVLESESGEPLLIPAEADSHQTEASVSKPHSDPRSPVFFRVRVRMAE